MKKNGILGRIERTIQCKKRSIFCRIWHNLRPECFFKYPKLVPSLWYAAREGRLPNFNNPKDFNERLMAINYHAYFDKEQRDLRIMRADKYAVRDFIKNLGYGYILNEIYGVYDTFEEIDFEKLPKQFVLKLTNGSGYNYICLDKTQINIDKLRSDVNKWTIEVQNQGLTTGEWHYNLIKSRIIIEKYLAMIGETISLVDYKFHCINQHVYGEYVCYDRDPNSGRVNYDHYDADWNLTNGVPPSFHPSQRPITKPLCFDEMKRIAVALSEGVEYVRVDLYEIEGKILFGELTFTPMGNYLPYTQERLIDMEQFYRKTKENK